MERTQIKDFTQGDLTRQLFTFALPLFLSNLLQIVYNMVDMIVVGNVLGKTGISAVSVGGDVSHLLLFVAMGMSNAGQVIIARYIGGKEYEKIGRFVGTMCSFLMTCAVVISILGLLFQDGLLMLLNTPAEAYAGASGYANICMVGLIFTYGYNMVSAILRGMGDSKHPFIFISIAAVLNLVLDLVFVMGMDMGAPGAALATIIGQGVSFVSCAIFLYRKREQFRLTTRLYDFLHWDLAMLGDLVRLGIPMAIKTASVMVSKLFVSAWINSYGVAISAFAGIVNKLGSVSNLISNALNTSGSTMVSQNIAARRYERVTMILNRLAIISLSAAAILSCALCFFPDQVFGIFTTDSAVLAIADGYLPIGVLLFLGGSCRAIMNALINGSGNYRINFATALLDGIILRIGLSALFGLALGMKHYGFWLGDALAGFAPFLIGLVFYISGTWKRKDAPAETV